MNIHHLLSPAQEEGHAGEARPAEPSPSLPPSAINYASAYATQPTSDVAPNFRPLQQPRDSLSRPDPREHSQRHGHAQRHASKHQPVSVGRPESASGEILHRRSQGMTPAIDVRLANDAGAVPITPDPRQHASRTSSSNSVSRMKDQPDPGYLSPAYRLPISRNISRQSLADLTMAEAPAQTPPPREFVSGALSDQEAKTVTELLSYLAENSYAYDQHVQLINLLHKGFVSHQQLRDDPHTYALLNELRQAREAMDTRFAVGEQLWTEWLADEIILAQTADERISLVELCQRAVQDEPASVKLWDQYASWVVSCHAACNELEGADLTHWTAEDREVCRDLFTKDMIFTLLEQAILATQWRIDSGHLVWNRYARLMQEVFPASPTPNDVDQLIALYVRRLQVPHAQWDETAQLFWPILSKYRSDDWEANMNQMRYEAEPAKRAMTMREEHEFKLQRALESADRGEIAAEFERYLKWEKKPKKTNPHGYQLICAVYERALLRHPTAVEWWIDYVDYCIIAQAHTQESLLPLIERATRHCPWSGELWGRRILRADVEKKSRHEIEAIKHRATSAGMLDMAGLDELIKVLQQWCAYLRRHAFRRINAEDDLDTAEVGITTALEDVVQAGRKLYGEEFQGDNEFRLEQVQIKFYTEGRRVKEARQIYRRIAKHLGHSFDFWNKWYNWELWLWGYDRMTERHRVETDENGPDLATGVAQEALNQRNLDFPEKVLEMYLYHFHQHESGTRLQSALVDAREFTKRLAVRRAREAEEAESAKRQQQEHLAALEQMLDEKNVLSGEKRKREDDLNEDAIGSKKAKTNGDHSVDTTTESGNNQARRDREHNTITLQNLPADIEEKTIKQFFRDVGRALSVNILVEQDGDSASATVEFETHDDVAAAKTRDGKHLGGREVHIRSGGLNTLYVCNYPPEYDEKDIRDLFKAYGEIVSVRFPSLKFNNRRRFCYVTFLTAEMAKAAEEAMDDKKLDSIHTLLAKISNPDHKKQKSGPQADGREVFVRNLERNASEDEVKQFFAQYGTVERMNLLRSVTGQKLGTGFIIFASSDEAESAAEHANNKPFQGRILHVEIAKPKSGITPLERAKKTDIIVKQDTAPEQSAPETARRGSDVSMNSSQHAADENYKTIRERKIAIFDLPDTVNDARVRVAMEKYGPITKIQLRRDRQGAIVEFATQKDAFNVRQGVDVGSLGPGVYTGDVGDLLKPERKKTKASQASPAADENGTTSNAAAAGETSARSALSMMPSSLGRPVRGGRRGGLGFKSRGGALALGRKPEASVQSKGPEAKAGGRSNDDFRKMLEEGKQTTESTDS